MTKYGQADVFLLIDGYDISGDTFELSDDIEAIKEQTDGFGDEWVTEDYVGVKRASITHRSFYDDVVGGTQEALVSIQGADRVLCAGVEGNAQGRKVVCFPRIIQSRVARSATRAELHKISAEYDSNERFNSTIIQSLAAEAGAGDTSDGSVDITGFAGSARVFLQVTELTLGGYTDVTIKVQDSADDAVFVDFATFTNVSAAPAAEALLVAGPVSQYVKTTLTWNGAGAGESITLLTAIAEDN